MRAVRLLGLVASIVRRRGRNLAAARTVLVTCTWESEPIAWLLRQLWDTDARAGLTVVWNPSPGEAADAARRGIRRGDDVCFVRLTRAGHRDPLDRFVRRGDQPRYLLGVPSDVAGTPGSLVAFDIGAPAPFQSERRPAATLDEAAAARTLIDREVQPGDAARLGEQGSMWPVVLAPAHLVAELLDHGPEALYLVRENVPVAEARRWVPVDDPQVGDAAEHVGLTAAQALLLARFVDATFTAGRAHRHVLFGTDVLVLPSVVTGYTQHALVWVGERALLVESELFEAKLSGVRRWDAETLPMSPEHRRSVEALGGIGELLATAVRGTSEGTRFVYDDQGALWLHATDGDAVVVIEMPRFAMNESD